NILKEGVASFGLGEVSPIVLLGKIVGISVEATSRLLKSTNAFA
ncbi:transposase, partial [Candidatus Poribacteria bacterium]|nr:transposase [Candidatus Poribacteria bacterium]MYK20890.1 transposase [Candidatus Poribacteria bacterium]